MGSSVFAEPTTVDGADWRPLRIVMIGQKGLPATYGGIEHHVEQIGRRLADRGHRVTVFCRRSYGPVREGPFLGMRLRTAPTLATKHLDALVHSTTSSLLALGERSDVVHYHGLGCAVTAPVPKYLSTARIVLTVHGLDHQRDKWGRAAKGLMSAGHWISHHVPDCTVAVSRELFGHYEALGVSCAYIPNGVEATAAPSERLLEPLGVQPGRYVLFVGRLVPEKRPDLLVTAFRTLPGDHRLVLVGGPSFTEAYVHELEVLARADARVLMPGYVYGERLAALYHHASAFVQPSALEGLPLTLLEAVAAGTPVIASDIAPHRELLDPSGAGGRLFPAGDGPALARTMARVLADPVAEHRGASVLREQVLRHYSWDSATTQLEQVYLSRTAQPRPRRRQRPGLLVEESG